MPFKIELTSKKDSTGVVSYQVEVTQDATLAASTSTFHPFATMDAAEQFKKAQVALFRSRDPIIRSHGPKNREAAVDAIGKAAAST